MSDASPSETRRGPECAGGNRGRFVATARLRWHVCDIGTGPDIVLLHGAGGSAHGWDALLPHLTSTFRVTAPDLPGHGSTERPFSSAPDEGLGLSGMAGSVMELLAALERRPRLVVGHSAGAAIGLEVIRRGGADAWVGINPALAGGGRPDLPEALLDPVRPLLRSRMAAHLVAALARNTGIVDRLLESTGSSMLPPASRRIYRELLEDPDHAAAVMEMMTLWEPDPLDDALESIRVPCMVVVGTEDGWVDPRAGRTVARRIPGARLVELPGLGHLAPEEDPGAVAEPLLAFAREVVPSA